MPNASTPTGGVAGAMASAVGSFIDKLTDPGLNVALGPQSALQVTPVIFQSVEQEGRWKPGSLVNSDPNSLIPSNGRVFELTGHAEEKYPALTPLTPSLTEPYGSIQEKNVKLFTVKVPGASLNSVLSDIWKLLSSDGQGATTCTFTVDATWWYDGLEIYGGWAGLANATGFGSVFNTTASVALQAIPFGNYFPASVLVTWSGWVNPIGPDYWEFRGGMVLNADGTNSASRAKGPPAYMKYWGRDDKQAPKDAGAWQETNGFMLSPSKPPSGQEESAMKWLLQVLTGGPLSGPFPGGS